MTTSAPELDTVIAEATPRGRAGLAILRISGPRAWSVAASVFTPSGDRPPHPWGMRHGHVRLPGGTDDEATCTLFRAPRTLTGEDVAEIGVHGNPWIVRAVLDGAEAAGARPARPGEFLYRAYLNGRRDLAKAEALDALIRASSPASAAEAARQARDGLDARASGLQSLLLDALAELEAAVDFHDDSVGQTRIDAALQHLAVEAEAWRRGAERAVVLTEGLRVVLAGPPNVGKSSLFNALLRSDRAIVTDEPGTTRDVLEGHLVVDGCAVTLVDTAGDRPAPSVAEAEGIRRSHAERSTADVVLEIREALAGCPRGLPAREARWLVLTKADLGAPPSQHGAAHVVSAVTGDGLEGLMDAFARQARQAAAGDGPALLGARQRHAARELARHVREAGEARNAGESEEYVAESLHQGLRSLAELTGQADLEDVYARVFQRFCVGK